ncbi:helix-turn-helix transcriptional regulator [Laspinema olomoucense]|uniref:helix-turn-helix transcriptional regulator n=1 Tax=Laspinema olomoucense TaxID=3231600 RepID=UPI0021BAD03A|nr:transcriptional regulator [Laspinema sp. D3d]MCT7973370.1 transcriptional regulator [Laspinema sp. D3d]
MSRHLERLLKIDGLLRSVERQTGPTLASILEVSDRTIRNDIAFLRDRLNAPLEYSPQKGYHYTDPDWRLPSINLSQGELFALTLGARMLECYAGSPYIEELRSAIARLGERLPEQTYLNLQHLTNEQIVFRPGAPAKLDPDIWHRLEQGCQTSRQVWMRYFAASRQEVSERVVDPYILDLYRGTNTYLIGFCHLRQEIRSFRVDRIQELKLLEETFVRDRNFDVKEYLKNVFQHEVGGTPQSVVIWFDARTAPYIEERTWHSSQKIEKHSDRSVTLQMVVSGMNEVKRWVLGYGKSAVVKGPAELVKLVREEVDAMNNNYGV